MKTVSVVGDHLEFLFWLGKTFDNEGYSGVPAVSIANAHSLLNAQALVPDLLISSRALSDDAVLDDMTGPDVVAKAIWRLKPCLPVISITGFPKHREFLRESF